MRERERERERKAWVEPELIVLVRNKPEEAVLGTCKVDSSSGGQTTTAGGCTWNDGEGCTGCVSIFGS